MLSRHCIGDSDEVDGHCVNCDFTRKQVKKHASSLDGRASKEVSKHASFLVGRASKEVSE